MALDDEDMPELATNEEWRGIMARARKTHGLTQGELAERVGCTQVMISKLESGAATSSTYIKRICRVLAIQLPEHFESEDQRLWSQLGRVLRAGDPEQYKLALALVENMAKRVSDKAAEPEPEIAPVGPSRSDRPK